MHPLHDVLAAAGINASKVLQNINSCRMRKRRELCSHLDAIVQLTSAWRG